MCGSTVLTKMSLYSLSLYSQYSEQLTQKSRTYSSIP